MDAAVAQNIKGYELRERIGAGGFGAVYRAYQTTVGREIAIKIILPGLANQPDFIRRFEAEAQLVARLEHPHITPLYDYWRDPDGAYLVMRWLRGGSLRDALQNGPFELHAAALLLDQIAGALSLAHRNNVIHRDIKPGNILLDEDGNAYLTDFGIAKDLNLSGGNNTHPEAIVGSLDYLSPEQARSEPITPRTDIYSLGVTMFEVITGHHPFENMSSVERLYKHINDPLPEIMTLEPRVNDAVNRVIQKATAKNPEHRYPDALAFAADFREAIGMNRAPTSVVELLTQREQEILALIIEGLSNKEIAQRLTVTLSTVKWYVNQIYDKLGVRSRVQAMVRARELNLLTRPGEVTSMTRIPTEDFNPENPYKGLRAFQAADNQDFFGREKETARVVKRLGEMGEYARFLAVVGPSGSGKSSLVKAGLIPALWRGELPGSEKWFVVELLPGSHPLDELEIALTKVAANQAPNMREHLDRDARGLLRVANLILPNDGSELVLIIDQFEEVFTLVEDEAERSHFLSLLHAAVTEPRSRVRVVVTLRADFYDRPLHYPDFGELVRTRLETVMPLSAEELERAITQPAQRVGVTFEPGLVATIVADVNYQPGALPLLQYALTELFENRQGRMLTREAYQAIGGTVGALAKRADELYLSLNENGQEIVRQMFLRLVTLGEGSEDTRRRTPRSELLAIAPDPEAMDEIIDTYASYRLLSLDTDPGTRSPTVEVAHEALLREWERLRLWLNDSRDEIKLQRQLAAMADEWQAAKKDASFLAHGSRLEQFEQWAAETQLALTSRERTYLDASLAERERQTQAEVERQAREKALERRSITFLRGLVAVFAIATVVATGLSIFALNQQQAALNSAAEAQNIALVAGSQAALANNDTDTAIALAWQAVELNPDSTMAQAQLSEAAYAPGIVRVIEGQNADMSEVAFSQDGQVLVGGVGDGEIIAWDVTTGDILWRQETDAEKINDVDFSPDGGVVASTMPGKVVFWNIETGQIIQQLDYPGGQLSSNRSDFSPDGRLIATGGWGDDALFALREVETGDVVFQLENQPNIEGVEFTPDGTAILIGSRSLGMMTLINAQTGDTIREMRPDPDTNAGALGRIAMSPDGNMAAAAFSNTGVFLWDLNTGELLQQYITNGGAFSVEFHPTENSLIYGTDTEVTVIDLKSNREILTLTGHKDAVLRISISADGRYAATYDAIGDAFLWELKSGHVIHQLAEPGELLFETDLSPDGKTGLVASTAGTATLFDVESGEVVRQLVDEQPIIPATFSPDQKTILTGGGYRLGEKSDPGHVILWDAETGEEIRRFEGHPYAIYDVEFSPDGRLAVSSGSGAIAILWDIATGEEIYRFDDHWVDSLWPVDSYWNVEFSPDGQTIIGSHSSGPILMWNVATGETIGQLDGHIGSGSPGTSFSADGQRMVSGGWDGQVILWNMQTLQPIRRFTNHGGPVSQVQFSPDERLILGGSGDRTNSLWKVETGEVLRRYSGGFVVSPNFTPDAAKALVGYWDGRAEIWRIDATLDELLEWTRANRYIPELTCEQRELYRLEPLCAEPAEA